MATYKDYINTKLELNKYANLISENNIKIRNLKKIWDEELTIKTVKFSRASKMIDNGIRVCVEYMANSYIDEYVFVNDSRQYLAPEDYGVSNSQFVYVHKEEYHELYWWARLRELDYTDIELFEPFYFSMMGDELENAKWYAEHLLEKHTKIYDDLYKICKELKGDNNAEN